MENKNDFLDEEQYENENLEDSFDFDELEEKLQSQLEEEFADLKFLQDEKEKIGNPDSLGEVIKDVIWEQVMNQIGIKGGEDFIKENNGLELDLRNEAHIQTTENFEKGNIATHNTKIDYKERYDDWQSNFQKDSNIERKTNNFRYDKEQEVWEKHDTRSDSWKKVLNKDARHDFDKGRPTGKNTNNTNMDHTISAAEIIRDSSANAHMTREEQIAFANSEKNLNLMDSAANQSKSDSTMSEWLDSEKDGKKAAERFNVDEKALRKKDKEARDEYEKKKNEAEKKSVQEGKKSQKEEAFRVGKKAIRSILIQLLAECVKEIIGKLVIWFKSDKKSLSTLSASIKEAIKSFISNIKIHLVNAGNTFFTAITTAILGPVIGAMKKIWMLLKQGWKSLKSAINYIKNPENRGKPIGRLLLETGKIIISGLTAIGAIALGEVIEKSLIAIPIFAIEIPAIGSIASVLGIFIGAVVAGIIGAIAINFIQKRIEKSHKANLIKNQINKNNKILNIQHQMRIVSEQKYENTKNNLTNEIKNRHDFAGDTMKESLKNITKNCEEDKSIKNTLDDINSLFDELEGDQL